MQRCNYQPVTERDQTEVLSGRAEPAERLHIRILSGPLQGRSMELQQGRPVLVGSSPEATLQVPDTAVSRLHLELTSDGRTCVARDNGSTNGLWFEGRRVERMSLLPGAVVRIGESTEIQLLCGDDDPLPPAEVTAFGALRGRSRLMRQVFATLQRAARIDATVLVTGETGTGKELVAEAIHGASHRKDAPFVVVDCASIPANLIESELFGHLKGAYTHAHQDREGAFQKADGGTVFLDEIGELPVELQPRLLRVLETKTIKPVGANTFTKINTRIIAATNRDLRAEVNARRFRSDLFFRLAVLGVHLPSLRSRREDIPMLAKHFAGLSATGGEEPKLSADTLAALTSYDWPGNVRELRNVVDQATALSPKGLSIALHLAPEQSPEESSAMGLEVFYDLAFKEAKKRAMWAFERAYVARAVKEADGNVSKAAKKMGLHRNMVHRILSREQS